MNLHRSDYRESECDECYAVRVLLVEVREGQDDHGSSTTVRLCEQCLRAALALITTEENPA